MSFRQFRFISIVCSLICFHWCVSITAAEKTEVKRPNILLITADNLGYGDLGCYGNRVMKTPVLDQLATEGIRLTDFYTASPTCTVSRATLLTGRYPQRIGLNHQLSADENYGDGLRKSEVLIPQYLKPLGYRTACFGKWNVGFSPGSRPTERGFDEFFGFAAGNIDYYHHYYAGRHDLWRGLKEVFVEGYSTDLFADAACQYIATKSDQPFFIYLPFNAPHFPSKRNKQPGQGDEWQAPDRAFEKYGYDPKTRNPQERYRAVVTALDSAIGRVLKQLDESGLRDNTIVIWYSDNGAFMLKDRGLEVASNKPLRDGGVTLWEGGIRVPAIIRYPGQLKAGTVSQSQLISLDILPTLVTLAGGELPAGRILDGQDMLPLLKAQAESEPRTFFFEYRNFSAVRRGKYKLLRVKPDQPFMLFDLEQDLSETMDLAEQRPQLVKELQQAYAEWEREVAEEQ
ncbi:sulfatase-like hydrolase/transferase [Gimesia sp.]|uniref:sulfatase-like hydrolase/transferase n=1 Tax=Gimesia sp. TaxID=2024833 RepID=UPI000C4205CB|nr:sulfatase-like hydrolase/transferase [Gimesia sp.]MAX37701.1 N-acetylgalactosamine-6-sulfatase [Gimesia sp.]HAH43347.1 N-acetylgalactosamine-6-sulfatase [Planctomycetaceae bacterium]HBL47428.1 N-acetylgalactosamine-6-sulfatase [Planctomycetaceae bacterium]|tara:strand:+ start:3752 stop:5122 length:1371 start_codon:yes stop_codon:yes gene_type:complete